MADTMIKGKVKVSRVVFQAKDSDFKILGLEVVTMEEGEVAVHPTYQTFTAKGNAPEVNFNETYTIIAKEIVDEKWGKQYELIYFGTPMKLDNVNSQQLFLSKILTDNQYKNLYETLENPFDVIMNEDVEQLTKVSGIGVKTAMKIIDKYKNTIDYSEAYVELDEYGLTPRLIEKLVMNYGSPNLLVQKIKENPYLLADEVDGIGFKKADVIALASGVDRNSPYRIQAFIESFLGAKAMEGFSYYRASGENGVMGAIMETLGSVDTDSLRETIYKMHEEGILWWDKNKEYFALKKYFNLEKKIAHELLRLLHGENNFVYDDWENIAKDTEKAQGWEFTEQQKEGIETVLKNQVVMITGYGGCVDADTEYFNGSEWKRIADYTEGDRVLQYHKDGRAELVKPSKYVKYKENTMTLIQNERGSVDQCLSEEHNVVYVTSKGNIQKKPLYEIKKMHDNNPRGFGGKFITTFDYEGEGIGLTNEEIRVMVSVIADGHFPYENSYCRMNLKKQRKKDRIEQILKDAKIPYEKREGSSKGYHEYYFYTPIRTREYDYIWYNCSKEQLEIIADEVLYWDSSLVNDRKRFYSTSKKSADFVQFVFSALGYRTTIGVRDRVGQKYGENNEYIRKSKAYEVHISKGSKLVGIRSKNPSEKLELKTVPTTDGYKYCFTVPTSMLVLRRNGRIFITGNTGKSSIVSGMLDVLNKRYGYSFGQCALSGRAGSRLAEVTGEEGYTIHRLLAFNPFAGGFEYNKENPLVQDIIIVDELSMVGGNLFYSLIKAVKDGAKLIMLCDTGQLESIGMGNIAKDIIDSGIIPTVQLTQIHRQAQKSAIVTESLKMRESTQLISRDFIGEETRGELQDLLLDIVDNKDYVPYNVIKHFKKELNNVESILDLQVVVPMKTRGGSCTFKLNEKMQEIYNPYSMHKKEVEISFSKELKYKLREGDKVLNNKNNYKTINLDGGKTPIYNGNVGTIEEIDLEEDVIIVNFQSIGKIIIPVSNWKNLELAYAVTCHKSQGSEYKRVIVGLDYSAYTLLSREWSYTAITRAREFCVLVAENTALRYAVSQSKVILKQTFLKDFLILIEKGVDIDTEI